MFTVIVIVFLYSLLFLHVFYEYVLQTLNLWTFVPGRFSSPARNGLGTRLATAHPSWLVLAPVHTYMWRDITIAGQRATRKRSAGSSNWKLTKLTPWKRQERPSWVAQGGFFHTEVWHSFQYHACARRKGRRKSIIMRAYACAIPRVYRRGIRCRVPQGFGAHWASSPIARYFTLHLTKLVFLSRKQRLICTVVPSFNPTSQVYLSDLSSLGLLLTREQPQAT